MSCCHVTPHRNVLYYYPIHLDRHQHWRQESSSGGWSNISYRSRERISHRSRERGSCRGGGGSRHQGSLRVKEENRWSIGGREKRLYGQPNSPRFNYHQWGWQFPMTTHVLNCIVLVWRIALLQLDIFMACEYCSRSRPSHPCAPHSHTHMLVFFLFPSH